MEDRIQENEEKKVVNLLRKSGGQFKPLKGGQFVRFMHIDIQAVINFVMY